LQVAAHEEVCKIIQETVMAQDIIRRSVQRFRGSSSEDRETLYIVAGVALIAFGAGLILSNPNLRRAISHAGWGDFASQILPEVERYFRR
jgi:hypothetical protein